MLNLLKCASLVLALAFLAPSASTIRAQSSGDRPQQLNAPPNPYIDKGACPFECCTYREWTANEAIELLDQPNGKKIVAHIQKGEKVQGLTGEVHSVPLRVVASRDQPDANIKRGDVFYVLHYSGECYWTVWHNGQLAEAENCSDEGPHPQSTWWVKVKTASGVTGWTVSQGNFSNQDACG